MNLVNPFIAAVIGGALIVLALALKIDGGGTAFAALLTLVGAIIALGGGVVFLVRLIKLIWAFDP